MGCIGSKPVVIPLAPAIPGANQQGDDTSKPWKKNQVVPAPQESGGVEGAGPPNGRQLGKAPSNAFVSSTKDTKVSVDQGPTDVFGELNTLCSDKVDGAGLANLAENLHKLLKHHLAGSLRTLSFPEDSSTVQDAIKRAVACCNSILQPLLTHINRVLSNRQAGSSWSESTSWEQVEFSDFLGVLEDACNTAYEQGVMEVGRPVAALIELIHELRLNYDTQKLRMEESLTQVESLDELMGMLGIIYFRKVVLETAETAQSKLEQYQQLQEQMGWSDSHLATCTGPEARVMLFYLNQVSTAGEKRANVTVRRSSAFWDAFECARRDGLVPGSSAPMCYKYFPLFVDEYAQDKGDGDVTGGRKLAVEAGEGHGPRKEFFALAGQDMAGQQPRQPSHSAGGDTSSSVGESRPALWVFNRTAGAFWYNTMLSEGAELKEAYAFAGWLLGQSLLNRAPLGLRLPPVLFQALLEGAVGGGGGGPGDGGSGGFQPTLELLAQFDPDAAAGVRNVAALPANQLRAMLELEGLPTDWTAERYTQHAAATVLRDGVAWQSAAVAAGFFSAVDRRLLRAWRLGPAALAALLAGGSTAGGGDVPADLSSLFRLALDDELSGPSAVLVEALWQVLAEWPSERRLRFVEFVTGTARLPLPGSELLKIQAPFVAMGAAEHKATLGMLPQAHTCDNLLELPNYWESLLAVRGIRGGPAAVAGGSAGVAEDRLTELRGEMRRILDDRLEVAVLNFQGYGLDERSGDRGDDDEELPGTTLRDPEPSPDPDIPELKPAALTADSLASLARMSASSSMLHSLAFSAAALSQPVVGPRGRQMSGTNAAGVGGGGGGGRMVRASALTATSTPGLQMSSELKTVSEVQQRQASLLARLDLDIEEGRPRGRTGSGGGAPAAQQQQQMAPARPQAAVRKRESSSEESTDAFK